MIGKQRIMIVIAQHTLNYVAIPLYTHNGIGLQNKSNKEEYVSIFDSRRLDSIETAALSSHAPLVAKMDESSRGILESATTHLTYPVAREYGLPVVINGKLDKDSTKRLLDLYNTYAPNVQWDENELMPSVPASNLESISTAPKIVPSVKAPSVTGPAVPQFGFDLADILPKPAASVPVASVPESPSTTRFLPLTPTINSGDQRMKVLREKLVAKGLMKPEQSQEPFTNILVSAVMEQGSTLCSSPVTSLTSRLKELQTESKPKWRHSWCHDEPDIE